MMVYKKDYYPTGGAATIKRTWCICLYNTLDHSLKFEIAPGSNIYSNDEFLVYYLINDEASKIYNKLESYIEVI